MEKFTKLGLSNDVVSVLKESGFTEPSEIQEKTIPIALKGKDIIGGSATGSGKTLAFAAPIIENLKHGEGIQAIILTPTRELADQVATSIRHFSKNKRLKTLAVYGGVNIDQQIRRLSTTDILVGTPGRILDHLNRRTLRLSDIKILVLDEVDRMFDMGFSRDVEHIINECPVDRQTMMFSATISSEIDYLAQKYSQNPVEVSVKSYIDHSKLTQIYYDTPSNKKFSLLVHLLEEEKSKLVMVFCSTRRNVDLVAENLVRIGIHARAIHGGLDQKKRSRILKEFHGSGVGVLVCTDVAARGLDIKGVSHVYNYDLPTNSSDYIHRIGRTARAGKEGKAINILSSRDYENFSEVTLDESLKIDPKPLPLFKNVRMQMRQRGNKPSFSRARPSHRARPSGNSPRRHSGGPKRKTRKKGADRSSVRKMSLSKSRQKKGMKARRR
jgi:ATP-dependent RNA helicase DeaD